MTENIEYWINFLNTRAEELDVDGEVKPLRPPSGEVGAISFILVQDGEIIELGWTVEEAEETLRRLSTT